MLRKFRNRYAPWSIAGRPDPDVDDLVRDAHRSALTAADLLDRYRQRFPHDPPPDYDTIIRRLGHVWDCPHDQTANVVGYRCATCDQTRAQASARSPIARDRAETVAYVRRLCLTYAERGV